ncbi:MAG: CPBP family intramembrane metalloprotease [Thaumarchaeota archaeon]|nr:CPBP family intramembrane metalloprotease [Nitrososphaerota archaeon]
MQSTPFYYRKRNQYLAVIFALALILLLIAEFSSFGVGAYYVFDKPISNVVAITSHNSTGTSLEITAVGLDNKSGRSIWIDPQISYDANGSAFVNASSGFLIGSTVSNSSGIISGSFPISATTLSRIESDGENVHTVWVIGTTQVHSQFSPVFKGTTADSRQNYSAATMGSGITFFITLITIPVPLNFSFGQLFLTLWTIYIILFAMAMNGPIRNMLGSIKEASTKGTQALFDNSMFATLIIFPVVVWVTVALSLLEQAGGVSTGSLPPADPLLQFVELSIAPLREELGFRVIPIGLAALLILFSRGRFRDGLLSLWHPSRYLKKDDTPAQYKRNLRTMFIMIGVSALLFGLAHVLLGAGWGPGKILSAAVAGIGLAGLYYLYGFPAAVLLHWSIDYFLSTYDLIPSLQNVGGLISLYTLGISVAGSIVLIVLLVRRLRNGPPGSIPANWSSGKI